MTLYTFAIGTVLIVLLAAAAAWAALLKGGGMRRNRSDAWRHLPTELQTILNEFANSMEASQAEIRKATKTGDAFMAAVKPIELVLRDFKKRITEFETRSEESEKRTAELRSSLTKCQGSLEGNAHAVERMDARLDEFSRQLAALTEGLSGLKQMYESSMSQHKATSEEMRAVASDIAMTRTQVVDLSRRLDGGETTQHRLSAVAESINHDLVAANTQMVGLSQRLDAITASVVESVSAVKTLSRETTERIAGLEPRLLWKIEGLETFVNSKLAVVDRPPIDEAANAISDSSPNDDHLAPDDDGSHADELDDSVGSTSHSPSTPPHGAFNGEQRLVNRPATSASVLPNAEIRDAEVL